ncbi:MAG: enoyl-CoA hydratase/isomerase family protein [Promethearchaeota archaeon]
MKSKNLDFGEYIEFKVKKRFGMIFLNRLHRANAFTIEQLRNLKKAIEYCQQEINIRGIILTNNGESFSTGMDLGFIDGSDHTAVKELESTAANICELLFNGKPVLCAVNGRTMGEGVVFLTCCDYKIATKNSFFQMPEIYSGIFPGTSCTILYSKILGINWAKKLLMFAQKVDAKKALEIGLIDEIVGSREELLERTLEMARFLSTKQQTVLNAIKLCVNHFHSISYHEAYEVEKEASAWYEHKDKAKFIRDFRAKFT